MRSPLSNTSCQVRQDTERANMISQSKANQFPAQISNPTYPCCLCCFICHPWFPWTLLAGIPAYLSFPEANFFLPLSPESSPPLAAHPLLQCCSVQSCKIHISLFPLAHPNSHVSRVFLPHLFGFIHFLVLVERYHQKKKRFLKATLKPAHFLQLEPPNKTKSESKSPRRTWLFPLSKLMIGGGMKDCFTLLLLARSNFPSDVQMYKFTIRLPNMERANGKVTHLSS